MLFAQAKLQFLPKSWYGWLSPR